MIDLNSLKTEYAKNPRMKFVFFWGHTPKQKGAIDKACFSQWYPAPFVIDGVRYPTAEHYMMAEKARLFGDSAALDTILAAGSPGAAKAAGRTVRGFSEATWKQNREQIVERASLAKFGGNEALRDFLLGTGNRVLVEASPKDSIWGIGLAADDARAQNPLSWCGLNLLGFCLMRARAALRDQVVQ